VKRRIALLLAGAVGLALLATGGAQAHEITYTYKSLFRLDEPFSDTGETLSSVIEIGNANIAGTVTGVSNYGDGEGAYMVDADGKGFVLSRPGKASPAGGTFGGGINNKVSLNDSGNVAFGVTVDRGEGEIDEVLFYDRKADTWTSIARKGTVVPGGTIQNTVSFATINNANDVVFTGSLASGTGVYLYDASTRSISAIAIPGTPVGDGRIENARRVQISQEGRVITFEAQREGDDNFGAYMWKDGTLTEIVRYNAAMPDADGKATSTPFEEMRGPIANANGDVVVLGRTDEGWGVFLRTAADGKLVRIAGPGDTVAGGKLAQVANSYRNDVRIGADGSVLFSAVYENDDRALLLRLPDKDLVTVARAGQELKGLGKITNIGFGIGGDSGLGFSTDGKIAFPARTEDEKTHLVLAVPNP
jgi:hypothetical protein